MEPYVECGGVYNINGQKVFGRKIYINENEIELISKLKFNKVDAYATNYMYFEEDQNKSEILGPLYIDLDGDINNEETYNNVKKDALIAISYIINQLYVPEEYIRIYFSGNKGFHLIVPSNVFGIEKSIDLNDKYKKIALDLKRYTINKTVDTGIYDKKRLLRLPNTINGKTGLYKVRITPKELREFSYKEIVRIASQEREYIEKETSLKRESMVAFKELTKEKPTVKKNNTSCNSTFINKDFEIPLCIKYVYANGAMEGQRNNTLIVLSSALLQKGMELEECIEKMQDWNIEKNEPTLSEHEVDATVRSAFRGLMDGRRYGCTSIKQIGACIGNACKIFNR